MAEPPQKKKKQSQGDMCKLLCLNSPGPSFIFYINNTYRAFLDYGTLNILKMHGTEAR